MNMSFRVDFGVFEVNLGFLDKVIADLKAYATKHAVLAFIALYFMMLVRAVIRFVVINIKRFFAVVKEALHILIADVGDLLLSYAIWMVIDTLVFVTLPITVIFAIYHDIKGAKDVKQRALEEKADR